MLIGRFQRIAERVHQRGAVWPQPVKRTGHDQFFQHAPVQFFGIGAGAQVEQLAEIAAVFTRFDDRLDRPLTHALDRADPIDDFPVIVDVEMVQARVNIRRQDLQPHAPALVHQANHLFGVVHIGGHYRRHKFSGIVSLQPQRLIRHQSISGGVGFVKSVPGEFFHQVEDFHRQFAIDAVFLRPIFKDGTLLGHLFRLFLTHRTTQHICAAKGVTRKHLGDLHDLFLIQDDAVGWLQYRFQAFMLPLHIRIGNLFAPVLTVDKVIYHPRLQRARTEQSHQRDHIFEAVWLQTLNQIFHAAGFKLEDGCRLGALQHVETFLVIKRDSRNIQRRLAVLLTAGVDHLQRPVDDGQRTQTKEVELHKPGVFNVVLVELGDRMLTRFIAVQRREVSDFGRGDNHAPRMLTGVTRDALQLARHVDQRFHLFVGFVDFRQLRFSFKGFRQGHARIGRHQLRDSIDKTVGVAQNAAHVADNRFRRHRTEGNDL